MLHPRTTFVAVFYGISVLSVHTQKTRVYYLSLFLFVTYGPFVFSNFHWFNIQPQSNSTWQCFITCNGVTCPVIWELVILDFLFFSTVSLYFRHIQLAFVLVCIAMLLLLSMKITKKSLNLTFSTLMEFTIWCLQSMQHVLARTCMGKNID